ncbi:MAG TPA: hypothetical protein VHF27_11915 [Acidimicrobiales bacterium]|nr:hypothetical protein [Acidimicrobiales bacterium]
MDEDDAPRSSSLNDSTKTTVAVLIALVVVLIVAGIGVATVRDATETLREATATTVTTAPAGAPAAPSTPSDLTPEQARVVEEVKAQVAEIRGLEWRRSLPVRILTKDQLSQRVRELNAKEIAEHREELTADESVLKLLKLIPEDLDYAKVLDDVLAGAVLGYYDDESKELFVGDSGSAPLDAATRSVLAHELTHALTDQHFDFAARTEALDDENRTEELAALSAVIEGDANLVEALWQERHLSDRERVQAALGGSTDAGALDRAPRYLLESLYFPYQDGLAFARNRHRAGGFAEVDNAYRRPPTSTEHILHPETYVAGQTWTPPPLPDLAAATGCAAVDTGTLGEFDMAQLLGEEISRSDARNAAAGWSGDAYGVVRCGAALGLADRWVAENAGEADELADALARWARGWSGSSRALDAEGRFSGPSGSGRVVRNGARVDLVLADDVPTADRLARALG